MFKLKSTTQCRIYFIHISLILKRHKFVLCLVQTHWRFHGLEIKFCRELSLLPLLYTKKLYHNGREYRFSCSLYHALPPIRCQRDFEQKWVKIQVFFELEPISSQTQPTHLWVECIECHLLFVLTKWYNYLLCILFLPTKVKLIV